MPTREGRGQSWRIPLAIAGLLIALLLALLVAVFVVPQLIVSSADVPDAAVRLDLQNDVRATLVQTIAGIVLVGGVYFTARNLQLARETQLTERFTKAIEQLGHESQYVRVGGIYALERIARDSKRDHPQVVEILAALATKNSRGTSHDNFAFSVEDIQAALRVLGRRNLTYDPPDFRLDLSYIEVSGVPVVPQANFANTDFIGAFLGAARMFEANLDDTNFSEADLHRVFFAGATLRRARLVGAKLPGANLTMALLAGADLSDAVLDDETRVAGALYDDATVWPSGFDPAAAGAVYSPAHGAPPSTDVND